VFRSTAILGEAFWRAVSRPSTWLRLAVAFALLGSLLLGCSSDRGGGDGSGTSGGKGEEGPSFPSHDPNEPFALDERGTVTLTNDQAYDIQVQRPDGEVLFLLAVKKGTVIDLSVRFTVQAIETGIPEDMAPHYVPVGDYALQMHAVDETGYGFALRPVLKVGFTDAEIQAAAENGGALDTLKGNLIVLYREQRSPKWVPQTSVSVDAEARTVTVNDVASAGAWRLAAKR
jgi:hypothetical protein